MLILIRLDISRESSARAEDSHEKSSLINFLRKTKVKEIKVSSAAIMLGSFRVKISELCKYITDATIKYEKRMVWDIASLD